MKLPDYNPEGKKLTWHQHLEKKRKAEEEFKKKLAENQDSGERPGRCSECDSTLFMNKCKLDGKGTIIRTCKACGDKKEF